MNEFKKGRPASCLCLFLPRIHKKKNTLKKCYGNIACNRTILKFSQAGSLYRLISVTKKRNYVYIKDRNENDEGYFFFYTKQ